MTHKPDWADEIAISMTPHMTQIPPLPLLHTNLAAAFRKAKADGMRLVCDAVLGSIDHVACDARCHEMNDLADQIEKGEV